MNHRTLLYALVCILFTSTLNAQTNELIKRGKSNKIGITDQALIDKLMKTMPKVGSNAKDLLLKQSIKPYMMPVRELGIRGTEMSYALAICLEYYINLESNYKANLSPDFIALSLKNAGKKGTMADGLELLTTQGTVSAAILPYDAGMLTNAVYATQKYKINNYLQMFRALTKPRQKVFETRKALMRGNPVIVEVESGDKIKAFNNKRFWNNSADDGQSKLYPLVVVGYDEDQQAFEVMSTWGSAWGNDGYLWIRYDDFGKMTQNAYVMVPEEY